MLLRSFRSLRSRCAAFRSIDGAAGGKAVISIKQTKELQHLGAETTWDTLVIGKIVECHPHPQADRLTVCTVNIGDENNLLQIICGARNVHQGACVPVAKVGTRLAIKEPTTGELKQVKIKKSKLRGEVSQGMICLEAELGLTDESDGILIFEADAQVGSLVVEHNTIASRLKARGIVVHSLQPMAADIPFQAEP